MGFLLFLFVLVLFGISLGILLHLLHGGRFTIGALLLLISFECTALALARWVWILVTLVEQSYG